MDKFDFEQFDRLLDDKIMDEVATLEKGGNVGGGEYEEIPIGRYEVVPEKMEMKASKAGNPMLTIWFRIVEGTYNRQMIFANFTMNKSLGIHFAKEFIKSLGDMGVDVKFETFQQWVNGVVEPISEIVNGQFSYIMEYGENKNKFKTYKIEDGPFEYLEE